MRLGPQVCTSHCLSKFIDPTNNKPYEKDGCLQCDEVRALRPSKATTLRRRCASLSVCASPQRLPTLRRPRCPQYSSGPAFIKCAGANRRSSGIISDIDRGPGQVCPVGYCTGKPECFAAQG